MIALTRFRIAAYVRSHRAFQPLIGLLILLAILHGARIPAGAELGAMADSAAILIPVFAWAARGLLDSEPDEQRMISITAVGRREAVAGIVAAWIFNAGLAAISFAALASRLSDRPEVAAVLAGVGLHLLAILAGTTLGALTSRPILGSPAASTLTLLLGYLAVLLLSLSGQPWLTVPVMTWMREAHHGELLAHFPAVAAWSLLWPVLGLAAYARLRRSRP
ncbi:hypothetical protein [Microtetraspora sp. NBRC 16547]|uniref:hypothetical protein n=1 Tax=Microtetraspora sp. NBRC 16547 TaxID=3030993 RepID=UPI0024A4802E|nr:hypothetical protein [Microtetraspora sp. NBRC 16547]GLX02832.1 hypothetical protein Misp02_69180 [Microtetraspora sp. NBRC 16547]